MIDKELFPYEYGVIEGLKTKSKEIEKRKEKYREQRLKLLAECRRKLDEESNVGRDG